VTDDDAKLVADLLRDARLAESAAAEAYKACDPDAMHEGRAKARGLRQTANQLDPTHECPAWNVYP
jgi:hypothetical protein